MSAAKGKTAAAKSTHTAPPVAHATRPFFQRAESDSARSFFGLGAQAKLAVGRSGDKFEREADTVADAVVGGGAAKTGTGLAHGATRLQRQAEREEVQAQAEVKDEPVQAKAEDKEEPVQTQADEKKEPAQAKAEEKKEPVQTPVTEKEEPVQSQAEEKKEPVQAQEEKEEPAQAKAEEKEPVQTQSNEKEEPVQAQADEDKESVQAQAEEKEEPVQAQADEEKQEPVQAQAEDKDEPVQAQTEDKEEPVQAEAEEKDEPVQAQANDEKEPDAVQPKGDLARTVAVPTEAEARLRASRGAGSPLPAEVKSRMETGIGADFSGVRIHTDSVAVELSRLLKAQAFTYGRDVYFNVHKFSPGTRTGDHLLAHELTHTVQQGAAKTKEIHLQSEPGTIQRQEDDADTIMVRPELLEAIKLARSKIGKINAKKTDVEGNRQGWELLYEFFFTAFGEKEVVRKELIKTITKVKGPTGEAKDAMPSWCGIMVWWAYKKSGIPIPDWKLGQSVLGLVRPRKPRELPRKGDIAYREQNQHFALVTGVEAAADRAGKDFKSIRVATLNGNTSGNDNLGGQVEEKWEPISRWEAFFDPVAKLDMPPVALVKTGVAPQPIEAAETETAEADAAEAAVEMAEKPLTDVAPLEEEIATEPEPATEQDTAVDTEPLPPLPPLEEAVAELPPPPAAPAIEEAAKVEELALEGPSDEAMVGFVEASPSQMAKTQPVLGGKLDAKLKDEQADEVENAPVLVAETSGTVDEGLTPPDQIPVPGDVAIGDGVTGADPGALEASPHTDLGPAPSNDENERLIEKQEEGGFLSWFRDNFMSFISRIRTKDPGVNTSAGERPNVALEGDADPGRMTAQRDDANAALRGQRDTTTDALKHHPGQQNIQPKQIKEEKTAAPSAKTSEEITTTEDPGAADYASAPLSADVRAQADKLLKPTVEANMAEAKQKTLDAGEQKDSDKDAAISQAEADVATANQTADKEQRDIVVKNRGEVAKQQKEGIEQAYDQVNAFNKEADSEQSAARKEVGDKVKDSEGKAREELDKGETDAEAKKAEGEKQAEDKKKELEKKEEDESWWDKAVGVIKDAVSAITEAIDAVFTWVRDAVKTIIEKAKNAAIGLINAARDWIVDKLNKFRDWAKGMVDTYLQEHFPGLAAKINGAIDTVVDGAITGVNAVADAAIKTVEAVAGALAAALDKILQVFQTALKAAVQIAGAVITGDFAGALRIAIQAGCDIAGIDSKPIFDFIDRAAAQVMKILKAPIPFFNNLMDAVGGGVRNFVDNIKQHLINGLIGWLTGALSETPIKAPATLDGPGILSLVLQVLGLTYENIKAKLIKKFPPAAGIIDKIEKGMAFVGRLVREGPMAMWEEAKASLASLKETVISGIKSFVITTVVKEAFIWLLSLLNPAGALVKVLKLLFDFVMFLIERFQQIKDFVMSVYGAIAAIAAGTLGPAMKAVEEALARSLPVVISLLARLAGLGGIGKTVQGIIKKISAPIHKIIDKVLDRIIKFAKKILAKAKAVAKKAKEKVKEAAAALFQWWKEKRSFKSKDGGKHSIFYKGSGEQAVMMVGSGSPDKIQNFLENKSGPNSTDPNKTVAAKALVQYKDVLKKEAAIAAAEKRRSKFSPTTQKKKWRAENSKVNGAVKQFRKSLDDLSKVFGLIDFGAEEAALERTDITFSTKPQRKIAMAQPLTFLSGKTVGSGVPSGANPPGWPHAIRLNSAKGKRAGEWVRGHLVSEWLHGPGNDNNNLVPMRRTMNDKIEDKAERHVKPAIKTRGQLFTYVTVVDFYPAPKAISDFPKKVSITWGPVARVPNSSPPKYKPTGNFTKVPFDDPKPPPATARSLPAVNLRTDGRLEVTRVLEPYVRRRDRKVKTLDVKNFVERVLFPNRQYNKLTDFNTLHKPPSSKLYTKRAALVNGVLDAIKAGKLKYK